MAKRGQGSGAATAARDQPCVRTVGNQHQKNPNNDAYWRSRGMSERPADWHERWQSEQQSEQQKNNTQAGQAAVQHRQSQLNRHHVNYWLTRHYDDAKAQRFASQGCDDDGSY